MKDIFFFDSMLTPKIITFVYWLLLLGSVDLCCTYFTQQYMGSHIIENASDTMLA